MFSSLEYTDCFADRFRFWVFDRCGAAALRKKHDICDDLLLFAVVNSLIQWLTPAVQFVHFIVLIFILGGAILTTILAWLQQKIDSSEELR